MPVRQYTFHAYRSWNADHPKGWIQRAKPGIQEPDEGIARYRDEIAKHPRVLFSDHQQLLLIHSVRDICGRRPWRCHGAATECTHVHAIVSWRGGFESDEVKTTFKRLLGLFLARDAGTRGVPYLSDGEGDDPVRDREHLEFLRGVYFPQHEHWWA